MNSTNDKNAIRPFHVNIPEAELTDLRSRIKATKWPERETVTDASQGVQLATILNSLQVINSSRFVLSATKDFSLASRMLEEKPHLRMPPLFEMA